MTTAPRTPSTPPRTAATAMLRAGLAANGVVAALAASAGYLYAGSTGAAGALVGSVLVAASFAASLLVLDRTRDLDPTLTLLIALALYVAKLGALLVVLGLLGAVGAVDADGPLDRASLGLTVVAATLVWSVVEVVAVTRHRQPVYDLERRS